MQAVIDCNTAWVKDDNTTERDQVYAHFSEALKTNPEQINMHCGKDRLTPLIMAAHFGLVIIVADLLAAGAFATTTDTHGKNATWYAEHSCLSNNPRSCPAALALLAKREHLNQLCWSSEQGTVHTIQPLLTDFLKAGGNINDQEYDAGSNGSTPLMFAAYAGNLPVIRLFLELGASTTSKNNNGLTALDWYKNYRERYNPEIIRLLTPKPTHKK